MVNCATTSTRRKATSLKLSTDLPLKTLIGLNEESSRAGYRPFSKKEISSVEPKMSRITGDVRGLLSSFPVKDRNQGNAPRTINTFTMVRLPCKMDELCRSFSK